MGSKRRADLANGLRLWASCESGQAEAIDRGLTAFVSEQKKTIDDLKVIEANIRDLEAKRLVATRELLTSWYSMTENVVGSGRTASTNDLVFWNRLIKASPETYEFLQPRWERLECLLVSSQIKNHQKQARAEKVAKILSSTDVQTSTSNHTEEGVKDEKSKEGKEG
jgi:hypothetical protein